MNTDPKKWNPFKFLRGAARKSDTDGPESAPTSEQWRASWPDIPRLFSREPWRAVEEFFHDPFTGRGAARNLIERVAIKLNRLARPRLVVPTGKHRTQSLIERFFDPS